MSATPEGTLPPMRDVNVDINSIMHTAYMQYSLSVNVGRAIPDVRDGLKPVNRRILYAMGRMGLGKGHALMKCAKVVGEVMGNYHPHGDSSIYEALVRMGQKFSLRDILIEPGGNFGNDDGDRAAASRYTECRMERLGEEMLQDINEDTVDMMPTFDETDVEPTVLPAKFPQLLVNGTTGIGVGMATNIPTHNLGEVIDATIALLDNPNATVDELMEFLPGPDFPGGAIIRGRFSLRNFYATGRGSIHLRARADIIEHDGREDIIISEIPYGVFRHEQNQRIAQLVADKKITGISEIRDESSDRAGTRVVIEVKRGAMAQVVLNQIYAHTAYDTTIGCTMLVVDHNQPRILNLPQVLQAYIDHRLEVVLRRSIFRLKAAEARIHIVKGLIIAVNNLDEVIAIIRSSDTTQTAQRRLMERFELSELQSDAILKMQLRALTSLAVDTLLNECAELEEKIKALTLLVESKEERQRVIKEELQEIKAKYSTPRRTEIVSDDSDMNIADLIPRHSCVITVSNTGYIKRVPTATYQTQHRGGVGIRGMETKEDDFVEHLFNAHSHDIIMFFTDRGLMYWLNVYEIPEGSRVGKGKAIVNLIKLAPGEKICTMLTVSREDLKSPDKYLLTATRKGLVKKTELQLYGNLRRIGLRALNIDEGDDLVAVAVSVNGDEVMLSSRKGLTCRFDQNDAQVPPHGRGARGVIGMRFKLEDDELVSMEVITEFTGDEAEAEDPEEENTVPETADAGEVELSEEEQQEDYGVGPEVLTISTEGFGKRTHVGSYRKTHRGGRGVVNLKLMEGEEVLSVLQVAEDDELLLTTVQGQIVRIRASEIRRCGRAAHGVRLLKPRPGDKLSGIAKIVRVPEEEAKAAAEAAAAAKAAEDAALAAAQAAIMAGAGDSGETGETPDNDGGAPETQE